MYDFIFSISNYIAMAGWMFLILLPKWKWTARLVIGVNVTLLALFYVFMIVQSLRPEDMQSFGSLEGIMQLFTHKGAVLAGWIHYLAFDLMTGLFIVANAAKNKINHWIVLPCLFFTFMLGPAGLLLYLIIRMVYTRKYFVETA